MELTTARLLLAPLDPDRDAEGLHAAFGDPEVMRWWNTPPRADVADTHKELVRSLEREGAHLWVLREAEAHRWTVIPGKTYWKAKCPCGRHANWSIKLTPSGANYVTDLSKWFRRQGCWGRD